MFSRAYFDRYFVSVDDPQRAAVVSAVAGAGVGEKPSPAYA
jgi:hypothetical protein